VLLLVTIMELPTFVQQLKFNHIAHSVKEIKISHHSSAHFCSVTVFLLSYLQLRKMT